MSPDSRMLRPGRRVAPTGRRSESACSSMRTDRALAWAGLRWRRRVDLFRHAQQVLHVVPHLMGDDIGLGEVARVQAALHFVEEAEVDGTPCCRRDSRTGPWRPSADAAGRAWRRETAPASARNCGWRLCVKMAPQVFGFAQDLATKRACRSLLAAAAGGRLLVGGGAFGHLQHHGRVDAEIPWPPAQARWCRCRCGPCRPAGSPRRAGSSMIWLSRESFMRIRVYLPRAHYLL